MISRRDRLTGLAIGIVLAAGFPTVDAQLVGFQGLHQGWPLAIVLTGAVFGVGAIAVRRYPAPCTVAGSVALVAMFVAGVLTWNMGVGGDESLIWRWLWALPRSALLGGLATMLLVAGFLGRRSPSPGSGRSRQATPG